MENLFSSFSVPNKSDWLEKVRKELKGGDPESLDWPVTDGIEISPFLHTTDLPTDLPKISLGKHQWNIAADYATRSGDEATINRQLLEELSQGVNAPLLSVGPDTNLSVLLRSVDPNFIQLNFRLSDEIDPATWLAQFHDWAKKNDHGTDFSGSVFTKKWQQLMAPDHSFPAMRWLVIREDKYEGRPSEMPSQLAGLILQLHHRLTELEAHKIDLKKTLASWRCELSIGNSYFPEIAKMRALRILWANLLDAWQLDSSVPLQIAIGCAPTSQTDDPHLNMIRSATQALSAINGGADELHLAPASEAESHRRIARNVHHILQMEAHINRSTDPAAGSYFLENLTKNLAEAAWDLIQKK